MSGANNADEILDALAEYMACPFCIKGDRHGEKCPFCNGEGQIPKPSQQDIKQRAVENLFNFLRE